MKAEIGKYGIWISQNEMNIIEKALEWMENSSYFFDKTSKIGVIKNLRKDVEKIRKNGVQIPKKVEIPNNVQSDSEEVEYVGHYQGVNNSPKK